MRVSRAARNCGSRTRHDDLLYENHGRPARLTGIAGGAEVIPGVLR